MLKLKHIFCTSLLLLLYGNSGLFAQRIENMINLYGNNFPTEKIHIHFDKESYLPGETIWFKAYVFEENLPSARSTNFYAGLYDDNGQLIQQVISPVISASSDGHFDIPENLQSKQIICRAHTTWMMNFDSSFYFSKLIKIMSVNPVNNEDKPGGTVSFHFFPEGGDIIEGERNTIAFKAVDNSGLPFAVNGVLKKQETGEALMPVKTVHNGMGKFDLIPQPNERFYAEWTNDKGILQQTYMPVAKTSGVTLKMVQQKNKLIYNIVNRLSTDSLHVLGYMYQHVIYKSSIPFTVSDRYTGQFSFDSLPYGILKLTVFNNSWQPIAERVCFINGNNNSFKAAITATELSLAGRGKNRIEIEVPDTIPSNMSVSITDAEVNREECSNNIISNLLLNSEVRGYIYNPSYYFTDPVNNRLKEELDLVMLTHGWRRYNWDEMLADKMPAIQYPPDNYLTLYGQVSKYARDNFENDLQVNLIVKTKQGQNYFYQVKPDIAGLIKESGMVFYDTARLFYSINQAKEINNQVIFSTSNLTFNQSQSIKNYRDYFLPDTTGFQFNQSVSLFDYYNKNKIYQLSN